MEDDKFYTGGIINGEQLIQLNNGCLLTESQLKMYEGNINNLNSNDTITIRIDNYTTDDVKRITKEVSKLLNL